MQDSPCVDICTTDPESGLCIGCSRTHEEIANWYVYSNQEKKHILIELKRRNKNC